MAQSWRTVATVVLSQIITLLFIGVISRVLRRKVGGPLDERSPRGCAVKPIKALLAGRWSSPAEVMNRSHCVANNDPQSKRTWDVSMNSVRYWTVASVIVALILLSPVVAFLMVISAELLIDVLTEAGTTPVCAVAIGAIEWVLFRRISSQPGPAVQSRLEQEPDEAAIAVPPI